MHTLPFFNVFQPSSSSNLVYRISSENWAIQNLEKIDELAETMRLTALCGLGHSTSAPMQTSIQNFRDAYLHHIDKGHCPVCSQKEGIYR